MQLLWSRAAQTSSKCRCGSCLHAATTVARQATTAASKRRVKVSDVFTACYSTMLGTAVFLDAAAKEKRKKEWDRKIAEVKAELKPEESRNERPVDGAKDYGQTRALVGGAPDIAERTYINYKPFPAVMDNDWTVVPTAQSESQLDTLLESINKNVNQIGGDSPLDELNTMFPTKLKSLDSEGLWLDYEPDPLLPNREPQTELQMAKMETMVANLVEKLLLASNIFKNGAEQATSVDGCFAAETGEMAQQIKKLFTGHTILPSYSWPDDLTVHEQRIGLYQSLVSLSTKYPPTNDEAFDVLLSKICYNLLVARAPPTIGVYNFLMREFTSRKRPDLTQIVMDSFFNESRFKANQRTGVLMLRHYASLKDHTGFRVIMRRMACTGKEGDMRIRARWKDDLHKPANAHWALTAKVFPRAGGLHEKMPRNLEIHEVIIAHTLARSRPRAAIMYNQICFRETQRLNLVLLQETIQSFLATAFILVPGFKLLQAVIKYFEQAVMNSQIVFPDLIISSVYELLAFCGVNPASRKQHHLPCFVNPDVLGNMLRILRIESVNSKLDEITAWTRLVRGALTAPGGVDEALNYIDQTSKFQRCKDAEHFTRYRHIRQRRIRAVGDLLRKSDLHLHKLAVSIGETRIAVKEATIEDLLNSSGAEDRFKWAKFDAINHVPTQKPKRQYKQPLEVWIEQNLAQMNPLGKRIVSRDTTNSFSQYKSLATQEQENLEAQVELSEERLLSIETEILVIVNAIEERRVAEQSISKEIELLNTAVSIGKKAIMAKEAMLKDVIANEIKLLSIAVNIGEKAVTALESMLKDAIVRRVDIEEQFIVSSEVELLTIAIAITEREILAQEALLRKVEVVRLYSKKPSRNQRIRNRAIKGIDEQLETVNTGNISLEFELLILAIAMVERRIRAKGNAALSLALGNSQTSIHEQDRLRISKVKDYLVETISRTQDVAKLALMIKASLNQTLGDEQRQLETQGLDENTEASQNIPLIHTSSERSRVILHKSNSHQGSIRSPHQSLPKDILAPPLPATTIKSFLVSSPSKGSPSPKSPKLPLTTKTIQSSRDPLSQLSLGQGKDKGPKIHLYTSKTRGEIPFRPVSGAVWSLRTQSKMDLR